MNEEKEVIKIEIHIHLEKEVKETGYKKEVIIALIGLAGTIIGALITLW